jgi:SAM-dependent methyltransferase
MQRRDPAGNEPAAIAAVVDLDGKRVLEVGCGTGRLTRFLSARAREVHAFDVKPEAVAEAGRSLPTELRHRVRFAVGDAEAAATSDAVDRRTASVLAAGLYRLDHERSLTVTDVYDDGPELLRELQDWKGTRIPPALARTLSELPEAVSLRQEIRLRVYRSK